MVTIVKTEPHPSVVKEVICRHCGVTLEYVPKDVKERTDTDYTGCRDIISYIECPACNHQVIVQPKRY
jgi:DNA-directed RNA polymerase subunit RPC12/RpoP